MSVDHRMILYAVADDGTVTPYRSGDPSAYRFPTDDYRVFLSAEQAEAHSEKCQRRLLVSGAAVAGVS